MIAARRLVVLACVVATLLVAGPARSHKWGKVDGSLVGNPTGLADCKFLPECAPFVNAGCDPQFLVTGSDGVMASIADLPGALGGHEGRFEATVGTFPPAVPPDIRPGLLVGFWGPDPLSLTGCGQKGTGAFIPAAGSISTTLEIPAGADWIFVNVVQALTVTWSFEGITH